MSETSKYHLDPNDPLWTNNAIREWQSKFDSVTTDLNDDNDRIYELYIVSSIEFKNAVAETRMSLNIKPVEKFNIVSDLKRWADENIIIDKKSDTTSPLKYFYETINTAIDSIGLPRTWRDTFAHYVVSDKKPAIGWVSPKRKIVRVRAMDDDSITIKFSKGIRYDEYVSIWTMITEYLGPGRR